MSPSATFRIFFRRLMLSRFLCLAVATSSLWGVLSTAAHAQLFTASINGTVYDPTGRVVPEASLALRNIDIGLERHTSTNSAGNYAFLNLLPSNYTLEASKPGFQTQISAFTLVVNQTATFDFTLEVGAVEQAITVQAVGAEVQSSTSELGAVVTEKQVLDLPLNGRNFTQLLSLTPGVSPVSVAQNRGGFLAGPIGQFSFPSINGQTNRSNMYMLDGIINLSAIVSTYAVPPIIDSVQEFKVQSHNDQAEFGQVLGGVVNVVTKSGTNELHGTAWEFLRNDAFDARNFFLREVTPFRWNHFGATVGGPVVQNRTFFFLGYQGFRLRRPENTFFRVPTEANLRGDLGDIPGQIFDPFTTRENPATPGSFLRDPFLNNQIPQATLDPGMLLFAKTTLPTPIATGVSDRNALDTTPFKQNQEEYTARLDHIHGDKSFFWFRWSGTIQDIEGSGGRQSLALLNEMRAKNIGVSWVQTFSPTSVLQVQFGRVRSRFDNLRRYRPEVVPDNTALARDVGFSDRFFSNFRSGRDFVPNVGVTDFFSGGENDGLQTPTATWQEKANYSKIVGNHTFKMGGEVSSMLFENLQQTSSVRFAVPQTSNPQNPGGTGSALASFLLNVPDSAVRRNVGNSMKWGGVISFYFQDQWKATPKLTVNLGLRYDRTVIPPFGKPEDGNDQVGDLDLIRGIYVAQRAVGGTPSCAQKGEAPCIPTPDGSLPEGVIIEERSKILHDTTKNFQPRVGLAYRLRQNTALRASFGIFFENWGGVTQTARNHEGTWPSTAERAEQNLNVPVPEQPTPHIRGTNPLPGSGDFPPPTPFEHGQWFYDPFLENPYSLQWNFGIQHQLSPSTVVTANYVGSGSRRLDIGGFYNTALTPGPGNPRERAPFPHILATFFDRSWGRSNYQAFQFLLDRKFSDDLAYMVSYTWSKSIDIACSGWFGVEGCATQDPYKFNNERGVSGFDLTHILTVNWVYQLPFGPGRKFQTGSRVLDYVVGNWQFNGIALLHSGRPYNLNISGDIANTGNASGYMRPILVGDPELPNPRPEQWINSGAFVVPAPFTFGNLGRHRLRSDWNRNFDLSIFRKFPIRESITIEFRAEAFNIFNTPTFAPPQGNMSSPNFGRVLSTSNSARQLQLGVKIIF